MINHNELIQTPEYWMTHIQNDLYAILDDYMKKKGINQSQLANELGFSKGYISRVLNGEFNHKLEKLVELALAVGKVPNFRFQDIEQYLQEEEKETPIGKKVITMQMNAAEHYWQKSADLDDTIAPGAKKQEQKFPRKFSTTLRMAQ